MASSFIDVCRFNPTLGGTTDWTYSSAVTGYQSPTAAGAVNGATYSYRAESADLTQWEIGTGAYNSGTGVFARTAVLFNSSGTTSKINFSTTPQVAIVALAEDIPGVGLANVFTQNQKAPAFLPSAAPSSAWGFDCSNCTLTIGASSNTVIPDGSGLIMLTDGSVSGDTGLYLVGGSAAALIGQSTGTSFVTPTTTPASGKYCVAFNGTHYAVYNGHATLPVTFTIAMLRTRTTT